jgi:hypothetical protein
MQTQSNYVSLRQTRLRQWRGLEWPVNEILLHSLVVSGKSDQQIADLCGVEAEHVTRLRQVYDL